MKRLVSFVLVFVMVMSIFAIVPFSAGAAGTKTVYFQNNWMWTDVKVYYWGSSSTNSAAWPGDTPQLAGNDGTYDIYAATVPSDVAGIIFNGYDSGKGGNNQTPDITDSADGDCYYMVWNNQNAVGKEDISLILPDIVTPTSDPTPIPTTTTPTTNPNPNPSGTKTVYFQNNWMWTDVCAYAWTAAGDYTSAWPGNSLQPVSNDGQYDIYSITVPSDVTGVIFNGFDAGKGGNNQTPDILDSADGDMYYMIWNDAEGKNDVGKTFYGPVNPTQAPVTQAPVTQAPVTQAPVTEAPKPTQAPATEAPTQAEVDGLYVKIGDNLYEVNKGDTFEYHYYLSVDSALKISSLDINMFYDTKGLDLVPYTDEYGDVDLAKHFPILSGGIVHNFNIDGEIYYNYSNVAGARLANDSIVFNAEFKVTADKGIYEISEKIITMADSDMNKIVYDEVVLQDVFSDKVIVGLDDIVDPTTKPEPTEAPTQKETEKPQPTQVVDDNGLYVVVDGEKFAVNKGDTITYNYYLSVDSSLKISSLDINMFYDTKGLDFVPFTDEYGDVDLIKHFPKISGGVVNNFSIDGEIYYNYSNVAGVRLANNSLVFTGEFKVTADKGTYNINSKLITMADSDMNKLVYDQEVIQPDSFTVKTELIGGTTPTEAPTKATEKPEPTQPAPTAEPTKPAPTVEPTEKPQPTQVVEDGLFVEMDGELYKVEKDQVITYQYILNVPNGTKISSIDMNTFYDTKGLDFIPYTDEYGDDDLSKHFPKISGGCVHNFSIDGEIYYNYSNVAGIRLTNYPVMFEGQFKVTADKGTFKIYTDLVTLADSNMNKIVYDYEVIQDIFEEKEVLVGLTPYEPTVAPTAEPTKPAPTVEPTQPTPTEAPEPTKPAPTVEPTKPTPTEAPQPTEKPTEAPKDLFVRVDNGGLFPVVKGEKYRYTFYATSPYKTGSFEASTWYDTKGLKVCPIVDANGDDDVNAMFPEFGAATIYNLTGQAKNGEILYNYSSSNGVKLSDDAVFVIDFEVTADEGTFDIFTQVKTVADTYLQQYWQYGEEKKEGTSFTSTIKNAASNDPDGLFIKIDDTYYTVEQGKEYTFAYYLQVDDKRIGALDARVAYDTNGLDFVPFMDEYDDIDIEKMFPKLSAPVFNYSIDGMLYFNYAHATGVKFPNEDSVLFTTKFMVTASYGVYEINPYMYCLGVDSSDKIVDEGVVLGDYYEKGVLLDAEKFDPNAPDIEEPDLLIGDVNRDGVINIFDVTMIQRYAAAFVELDAEQMIIADTNFDGTVNIFDASEIQRYVAGYIAGFVKR